MKNTILQQSALVVLAGCLLLFEAFGSPNSSNPEGKNRDENKASVSQDEIKLEPRVKPVPGLPLGSFVRLKDGSLLTAVKDQVIVSSDNGKSWDSRPMLSLDGDKISSDAYFRLVRTRDGVIIAVFMDLAEKVFSWDEERNVPNTETYLPVWSVRSLDEGRTWVDKKIIYDGWCGAIMEIIQTSNGNIVLPMQELLYREGRHVIRPYVSQDNGETWTKTNYIDTGGRGHHDGNTEPTLVELNDGRLWMLLRTNFDYLWTVYSNDQGLSWTEMKNSRIDASSSPAFMIRLASGRLVMTWNRLKAEGTSTVERRESRVHHENQSPSWFRNELAIAFSDDEGASWTKPVVVATKEGEGARLSYPYIFEYERGKLWVTTGQGELKISLNEKDFTGKKVEKVKF